MNPAKRDSRLSIFIPFVVVLLLHSAPSDAGPDYAAAMAEVRRGEMISDTGNLDEAMAVYRGVAEAFPDESEAVGWAHHRISQCLFAGGRFSESCSDSAVAWELYKQGIVTSSEYGLRVADQYARCLSRTGGGETLASVSTAGKEICQSLEVVPAGMESAYGWFCFFTARCLLEDGEGQAAYEEAVKAYGAAQEEIDEILLGAAARMQGQALLEAGNPLLAVDILLTCERVHAPQQDALYGEIVRNALARAREQLGDLAGSRDKVLEMLANDSGDLGYAFKATIEYARAAVSQNRSSDALGPLILAQMVYPHVAEQFAHIGKILDEITQLMSGEDLTRLLRALADETPEPLEHAAVRLYLAKVLANRGSFEEARSECVKADLVTQDPRLEYAQQVAEWYAQDPGSRPDLLTVYEQAFQSSQEDRGRALYFMEQIRKLLYQRSQYDKWSRWLNEHESLLPPQVFALEKAIHVRDRRGIWDGALAIIEDLLDEGGGDRRRLHSERIYTLALMKQTTPLLVAIAEFEKEIGFADAREETLVEIAQRLRGKGRAEECHLLTERVKSRNAHPVWYRESLLLQAQMKLAPENRPAEAAQLLESLVALPPLTAATSGGIVGEAHTQLAEIYYDLLDNRARAIELLEAVINAPDAMPLNQDQAWLQYMSIFVREHDDEGLLELCERGLEMLPPSHTEVRSQLEYAREQTLDRLGPRNGTGM